MEANIIDGCVKGCTPCTWACLENCLPFALFIIVNTIGALVPWLQTRSLSSFVYLAKISRTFSCTLYKYYIESSFMDYLIAIWLRLWPVYFSCALCSVCQFNSFINYYRIELVLQRGLFHYLVIAWWTRGMPSCVRAQRQVVNDWVCLAKTHCAAFKMHTIFVRSFSEHFR